MKLIVTELEMMKIFDRIADALGDKRTYFSLMVVVGLLAFDLFNFATTKTALESFMGSARVLGIVVAQALAVAFCAVDLGGLTSLFTEEKGFNEPWWVWMFGAGWLTASAINAALTWWAVLLGMPSAPAVNNPLFTAQQLYTYVPAVLAVAVWLIRLLLVGATILAWDRSDPMPKLKKSLVVPNSHKPIGQKVSFPAPQRPPISKPPEPVFTQSSFPKNGNGSTPIDPGI
jgi:hypothetical protein